MMKNAPTKPRKSIMEDTEMMIMVLRVISSFLLIKLAVNGRRPAALPLGRGPLPVIVPCGGDDGIPDTNCFSLNQ